MEGNNSVTVIYLSCSYHSVLLSLYTAVVPRVCVCVCVSVHSFLPVRASRPQNIGTYVFTATQKTLLYNYYNCNFLLKMLCSEATASFACLDATNYS